MSTHEPKIGERIKLSFKSNNRALDTWNDNLCGISDTEVYDDKYLEVDIDNLEYYEDEITVVAENAPKKACRDCSCGLKDAQVEEKKKPDVPKPSKCGSCYLGDAMRCGGCPYRGFPPFNPGEQIKISLEDDDFGFDE